MAVIPARCRGFGLNNITVNPLLMGSPILFRGTDMPCDNNVFPRNTAYLAVYAKTIMVNPRKAFEVYLAHVLLLKFIWLAYATFEVYLAHVSNASVSSPLYPGFLTGHRVARSGIPAPPRLLGQLNRSLV
jgi:hypothetical protein